MVEEVRPYLFLTSVSAEGSEVGPGRAQTVHMVEDQEGLVAV